MKKCALITVTFLFIFYFFGDAHGKKKSEKKIDQNEVLKKLTTSLEKCVKKDKTIISKKNKISPQFKKCLTALKKQKSLLNSKNDNKNKSMTKTFFKKVFKTIIDCLKSKIKKSKKKPKRKKRQKRSKKPTNVAIGAINIVEEMRKINLVILEKLNKMNEVTINGLGDLDRYVLFFLGKTQKIHHKLFS